MKVLDTIRQAGERVFTVQATEGPKATLLGMDRAVDLGDVILTADPGET